MSHDLTSCAHNFFSDWSPFFSWPNLDALDCWDRVWKTEGVVGFRPLRQMVLVGKGYVCSGNATWQEKVVKGFRGLAWWLNGECHGKEGIVLCVTPVIVSFWFNYQGGSLGCLNLVKYHVHEITCTDLSPLFLLLDVLLSMLLGCPFPLHVSHLIHLIWLVGWVQIFHYFWTLTSLVSFYLARVFVSGMVWFGLWEQYLFIVFGFVVGPPEGYCYWKGHPLSAL